MQKVLTLARQCPHQKNIALRRCLLLGVLGRTRTADIQNAHLNVVSLQFAFPFLEMRFIFGNKKGVKWVTEVDINEGVTFCGDFAAILRQYSLF
jgi:hypothetical protein